MEIEKIPKMLYRGYYNYIYILFYYFIILLYFKRLRTWPFEMSINTGWTILFTHFISKMYSPYTRLLRNVVKSYWVAHIFHFIYVTSWIWVHSIPTIIDITTFTGFNFDLRSPLIFIFQKNKCTFAIPVATTFANNHIPAICASYWIRTSDWIFIRDLPLPLG